MLRDRKEKYFVIFQGLISRVNAVKAVVFSGLKCLNRCVCRLMLAPVFVSIEPTPKAHSHSTGQKSIVGFALIGIRVKEKYCLLYKGFRSNVVAIF